MAGRGPRACYNLGGCRNMARLIASDRFKVIRGGIEYEFEPAEEGGYVASVPLYPSCVSQGETFEEALANVEDALKETLAAAKELGLDIPGELTSLVEGSQGQSG